MEEHWVPTVCNACYNNCTVQVRVVNGVMRQVAGIADAPPNYGRICAKGQSSMASVYSDHRVLHPMVRTNPRKGLHEDPGWRQISWDEAMGLLTERLGAVRSQDPRRMMVLSFDGESYLPIRAFTSAFGSPNYTTGAAGYFCGNAIHPVAYTINGCIDFQLGLEQTEYCMLFGCQYGSVAMSHAMRAAGELAESRRRGLHLVVVDPVLSNAAAKADEWVPIRPGTDAALALGMIHLLLDEYHLYDADYLRRYTNGPYLLDSDGSYQRDPGSGKPLVWDLDAGSAVPYDACELPALEHGETAFTALRRHLAPYTPERVEEITTIPAETVRRLAREFGQAACIGRTIRIDGRDLPHRPAVAFWYRGVSQHKHSLHNGLSMALLNLIVGNVDVPGGLLNANAAGPFGFPEAGQDGLLTRGNRYSHMKAPWPPQRVSPPESLEMLELFPLSVYSRAMPWLGILEPERYHVPYQPEVLLQCRSNIMMTTADRERTERALKSIPFMASFVDFPNETSQLADLMLPDAHNLERLCPFACDPFTTFYATPVPGDPWWFAWQQPVCPPRGEARYWVEVLLELGDRLGFRGEMYDALNAVGWFKAPYLLEPDERYTWEQICDRWARSRAGVGIETFKRRGYVKLRERTVEESFPRIFHNGRIPIYFEHFRRAGQEVERVTSELGIPWDTSDYTALVDWKPCPAHGMVDRDALWLVNTKVPFYAHTVSAENSMLNELCERHPSVFPVRINPRTADRLGLADGQEVWVESCEGAHRARARLLCSEGVHPDALASPGVLGRIVTGDPDIRGQGLHYNGMLEFTPEKMDYTVAAVDACVRVKLRPA